MTDTAKLAGKPLRAVRTNAIQPMYFADILSVSKSKVQLSFLIKNIIFGLILISYKHTGGIITL